MSFWSRILQRKQPKPAVSPLFDVGFHGDRYFLALVDRLMPEIDVFIETGTNVGTTTRYVAKTYPGVTVYSCEPNPAAFQAARQAVGGYTNAHLYRMKSPDFLYQIHREQPSLKTSRNLYWLDAHGQGFRWPLHDEIAFITQTLESAIIMVDDARVPDHPQFTYCAYDDQECNLDYIANALTPGKTYQLAYPTYQEHTSPHHPLVGYLVIGFGGQRLPGELDHFSVQSVTR